MATNRYSTEDSFEVLAVIPSMDPLVTVNCPPNRSITIDLPVRISSAIGTTKQLACQVSANKTHCKTYAGNFKPSHRRPDDSTASLLPFKDHNGKQDYTDGYVGGTSTVGIVVLERTEVQEPSCIAKERGNSNSPGLPFGEQWNEYDIKCPRTEVVCETIIVPERVQLQKLSCTSGTEPNFE